MSFLDNIFISTKEKGWRRTPVKAFLREVNVRTNDGCEEVLGLSKRQGVLKKSEFEQRSSEAESYVGYKKVKSGQLISNKMQAWNGIFGISSYDGITSPDYAVYDFVQKVESKFVEYLVRTDMYAGEFLCRSKGIGTGFLRLNPSDFLSTPIWMPDTAKQKEITDFLDRETSRIDQLIEKKWSLIETLPLRVEALIDKALSASNTKWLRFGYAAKMVFRAVNRQDNEPYIAIGLYNRGRGIFHKEETYGQDLGDSTFSWIKPNDLIFSGQFAWEGAVALASEREDNKIASHRYPIYNARDGIESAYLFSYFRTHRGKFLMNDCSRGAAGRNRPLNTNRLEKEQIPIPSSSLQKQVAALVQQEDILKAKITESIQALNAYKASLVTEAVTGQLDIHAWQKRGTGDRKLDQIQRDGINNERARA